MSGIGRCAFEFWGGPKRAKLERLTKGKWAKKPSQGAMSAGEACARIWAWLDGLDSVDGAIPCPEEMADMAGWHHEPKALMDALMDAGMVDVEDGTDYRWHNWKRLNGRPISGRIHRRKAGTMSGTIDGAINAGSDSYSSKGSDTDSDSTDLSVASGDIGRIWNQHRGQCSEVTVMGSERLRKAQALVGLLDKHKAQYDHAVRAYVAKRALVEGKYWGFDTFLRAKSRAQRVEDALAWANGDRTSGDGPVYNTEVWK